VLWHSRTSAQYHVEPAEVATIGELEIFYGPVEHLLSYDVYNLKFEHPADSLALSSHCTAELEISPVIASMTAILSPPLLVGSLTLVCSSRTLRLGWAIEYQR
jgi:hypothetical protein